MKFKKGQIVRWSKNISNKDWPGLLCQIHCTHPDGTYDAEYIETPYGNPNKPGGVEEYLQEYSFVELLKCPDYLKKN